MAQLTSDATERPCDPAKAPGRPRGVLSAWAALLVVWVVWGSTYRAIRVADESIPPFAMAAARYLAAGAVLYPAAWLGSRPRPARAGGGPGPGPRGPPARPRP